MRPRVTTISDEASLCQVWESIAYAGALLCLEGGGQVVVISRGVRNAHAGPDYLNGVLLLDGIVTVGDIELHCHEREWFEHRHDRDRRYDGVILHVVAARSGRRRVMLPTFVAGATASATPAISLDDSGDSVRDTLCTLAWSRLMRRVSEARALAGNMGCDPLPWLIEMVCRVIGTSGNSAALKDFGAVVAECVRTSDIDSPKELFREILDRSGYPRELFQRDLRDLTDVFEYTPSQSVAGRSWSTSGRSSSIPGRQIVAIARLAVACRHNGLLYTCVSAAIDQGPVQCGVEISRASGSPPLISAGRAMTITFDAVLPACIAVALTEPDAHLLGGLFRAWRCAPTLPSNRIIRRFEQRFLRSRRLQGAFWQAGAMEFERRYGPVNLVRESRSSPWTVSICQDHSKRPHYGADARLSHSTGNVRH